MVYAGKELAYVTFKYPCGLGVVFRYLAGKRLKLVHRLVRTLPYPTRVGVVYKCFVEEGIENSVDCMVEQPVAHTGLVDVARLGVGDFEVVITTVSVRLFL